MDIKGEQPIDTFQVWFRSPFGLHTTLDQAVAACSRADYDVSQCIVSVSVAVASNGDYEEMRR